MYAAGRPANPFSAQRHGPGGIEYLFESEAARTALLAGLDAAAWNAELVAPKGFGKSTLLAALQREAAARGWRTAAFRCSGECARLPLLWRWNLRGTRVCFVDGAERLAGRQLAALRRRCAARRIGLVLTAHAPIGHGRLHRVEVSPEHFARIARALAPDTPESAIAAAWAASGAVPREAMWRLYEWHERR